MALENNPYPQDVRVRNEAEALAADGHHVVVLAPRGPGQPRAETVNGDRVKRYRLPAGARVGGIVVEYIVALVQLTLRLLAELCRGADVIHLHNPPDLLFGVAGLARVMGKAVIFDHHDLAPELFEQKFGSGLPAVVLRWCERMTIRVAHVVIAANESHRRVAIQRGHVDRERVVVVRNAPREDTIATAPRTREGVLRSPRLCYVGSLGSQDGVRYLAEDPRATLPRRIGADARSRGGWSGARADQTSGPAPRRARPDPVHRAGFHDQVPGIIEAADICLDVAPCTALNHQSTMIKIGEYLAAGRPIVTFALQETHHTAGDCALYAACDDLDDFCGSIMRLCADEGMRAKLSAEALERARAMTWEHSAERLRHAYGLASDVLTADGAANDRPAMVRSTFVSWTRIHEPTRSRMRWGPPCTALRLALEVGPHRSDMRFRPWVPPGTSLALVRPTSCSPIHPSLRASWWCCSRVSPEHAPGLTLTREPSTIRAGHGSLV